MEYILTSLDVFAGITENLINYSFNVSLVFPFPMVLALKSLLFSGGIV